MNRKRKSCTEKSERRIKEGESCTEKREIERKGEK